MDSFSKKFVPLIYRDYRDGRRCDHDLRSDLIPRPVVIPFLERGGPRRPRDLVPGRRPSRPPKVTQCFGTRRNLPRVPRVLTKLTKNTYPFY